ncbi:four helix bundle suffix domain-containing protein [uncultured Muribaculum sp.]|uniref:four helix bundle suffix domain-containing protein n=1 Tax=uncultured Muribaculum sp. TaxID=1918613 RepID=UPI0025D86F5F|nr:four helix bundle suffix domain-containing protein [uncultured Muribaculum sp.]
MNGFLPKSGGYRQLRAFRLTEIIHELTAVFVKRFIRPGSRTVDQMEQAARSGKQNIAEGSKASMTSKGTEIKLTNVAKASLEELQLDYEDYLRHNGLRLWDKAHPRTLRLRDYLRSDVFMNDPVRYASTMNAEEYCNMCITLINQTTYMLRRLIERQQEQFLRDGGIKERMYRARVSYRTGRPSTPPSD